MPGSDCEKIPVAIIGAGIAGLAAAHYLSKTNRFEVSLFEKADEVGGKCSTLEYKNRIYEMGAVSVPSGYRHTKQLAREYGQELFTPKSKRWILNREGKFIAFENYISQMMPLHKWAYLLFRYFIELRRNRKYLAPQIHNLPQHLSLPFEEWARARNFLPLLELFKVPVTHYGYGDIEKIPAAYVLKYMNEGFIRSLIFGALGKDTIQLMSKGYGGLASSMASSLASSRAASRAASMDMHLGCEIRAIRREGETVIVDTGSEQHKFSKLILACPVPAILQMLDLEEPEKQLLKRIKTQDYNSALVKISNMEYEVLYRLPATIKDVPLGFYANPLDHSDDHYIVHYYGKNLSPQGLATKIEELLELPDNAVEVIESKHWEFFPAFNSADISEGLPDQLAAIQGKKNTFYLGGAFSFECVELVLEHCKEMVSKIL